MPARHRLLVLGQVTASALGVTDGLGKVGMAARRVALATAYAHARVKTLDVLRADGRGVTGLAILHVRRGSRDGRRIRAPGRAQQKAAAQRGDERSNKHARHPRGNRTARVRAADESSLMGRGVHLSTDKTAVSRAHSSCDQDRIATARTEAHVLTMA